MVMGGDLTWGGKHTLQHTGDVAGVSGLWASLGHTGRRVVLGHTLNTQMLMETDEQEKILGKFTILCWATFIDILGWTPLHVN